MKRMRKRVRVYPELPFLLFDILEVFMEQTKENKMGIMPVNQLLITMSLPMVLSMLVQALYNVVDSILLRRLMKML